MRNKILIHLLMVLLFTSLVNASLENVRIIGTSGIEGYYESSDTLSISAIAYFGNGDPVTTSNIEVNGAPFNSGCTDLGNDRYSCQHVFSTTPTENSFEIELIKADRSLDSRQTLTAYLDNIAPTINGFDIVPSVAAPGSIEIQYSIADAAKDAPTDSCVGLDRIEIVDKDSQAIPVKTIQLDGECSLIQSDTVALSGSGRKELCIRAYDRFDNNIAALTNCDTVELDNTGVTILANTAQFTDREGLAVGPIKDSTVFARFTINISGTDFASAIADFSTLNPAFGQVDGTCNPTPQYGLINCVWNVDILPQVGTKRITISAFDVNGNPSSINVDVLLTRDDVGPTVSSLGVLTAPSLGPGGLPTTDCYISSQPQTFMAGLVETGGGLRASDVQLSTGHRATSCEQTSTGWQCIFENVALASSTELTVHGSDKLGNAISDSTPLSCTVDNSLPHINAILIEKISDNGLPLATGDSVRIITQVAKDGDLEGGVGDFSVLSESKGAQSFTCTRDRGKHSCQTIVQVTNQGPFVGAISVVIRDRAGNEVEKEQKISVLAGDTEEPDYYEGVIIREADIQPIDLTLASYMTRNYYYNIPFNLKFREGSCSDIDVYNMKLEGSCAQGGEIFAVPNGNDFTGYMQFQMNPQELSRLTENTGIGVSEGRPCHIAFTTECGDKLHRLPEIEEVAFNIPIVNSEDVGQDLIDEVEKIKADVERYGDSLGRLQRLSELGQSICKIKDVVAKAQVAITVAGSVVGKCTDTIFGQPFCKPIEKALSEARDKADLNRQKSWRTKINTVCNYVTCKNADVSLPDVEPSGPTEPTECTTLKKWMSLGLADNVANYAKKKGGRTQGAIESFYGSNDQYFTQSNYEFSKESIVFAAACRCIPGLIYNMHKKQQNACWKGVCYRDMTQVGMQKSECDQQDRYNSCVWWSGQFIFPNAFEMLIGGPVKKVLNVIKNPVASAFMVGKEKLRQRCKADCPGSCTVKWDGFCAAYAGTLLIEAQADISNFKTELETAWNPEKFGKTDYCKVLTNDPEVSNE